MPTYHRSQRLRLVGTGPKVEQLQEGRFRLTFTCSSTNPSEAWMQGNKSQIFAAYGTLESAEMSIAGIAPRTSEAYSDMVLFRTEANPSERDLIVTLIYETATTSFVKSQDDKIDFELNGLQRVTRVTIAKTGTSLPSVTIGTTSITVNGTACKLASRSVEENDAFIQITETYLQSGITDVREDIVGSQKAIVITKVGSEPTESEAASKSDITYDTSNDWSVARKDVAQEGGLKIYTYTFLLDNTILSQSQDRQSSLKTEVIEVFNPKVTIDGLTIDGGSTIAGNYFLSTALTNGKNRYFQSQGDTFPKEVSYNGSAWQINQFSSIFSTSSDTNPDNANDPPLTGWSGTGDNELFNITFRQFDQTLPSSLQGLTVSHRYEKRGYSLIGIQQSNLDGVPTMRYTFAKDNSIVSVTEDKVGSQNAIVNEIFNPASESITGVDTDNVALSGYSEVDRTESNYEGVKTIRVRFLKDDTVLSKSTDSKSPLLTEVLEVFKPSSSRDTKSSFTLVSKAESNVDGIPTERYTFERNGVILSESFDLVGSQKSVVISKFQAEPTIAEAAAFSGDSGYTIARKEESGALGKETYTYTFLKPSILSRTDDKQNPACPITIVAFDKDETDSAIFASANAAVDSDIYVLVSKTERDFEGIETFEMRFEKKEYFLKESKNEFGRIENILVEQGGSYSLLAMPGNASTINTTASSYVIAQEITEGIVPKRTVTYSTAGIESVSEDLVGSTKVITITKFISLPTTSDAATYSNSGTDLAADFILISDTNNRVNGVDVYTYKFAIENAIVSTSLDAVGSQKAVVVEKFGDSAPAVDTTINGIDLTGYSLAREDESNVEGIKTFRYTFLRPGLISTSADLRGVSKVVRIETFNETPTEGQANTAAGTTDETYSIISEQVSNTSGIATKTYLFVNTNTGRITDADRILEDEFSEKLAFNLSSENQTPSQIATNLAAAAPDGTDTAALTPNITIAVDPSEDEHNTLFLDTNESIGSIPQKFSQTLINIDTATDVLANGVLVNKTSSLEPFLYPGIVEIARKPKGLNDHEFKTNTIQSPITAEVQCVTHEFIQTGDTIVPADYTLDLDDGAAAGLWSPNNWASYNVEILGNNDTSVYKESQQYKSYRFAHGSFNVKSRSLLLDNVVMRWQGNTILFGTLKGTFIADINQGPPNPIGLRWTLSVDIVPIGVSSTGDKIYKKTVLQTRPIRSQKSLVLPY